MRENGECYNSGYFIEYVFSLNVSQCMGNIYILVWPKLALVWRRITVKFAVVCIIRTHVYVYVRTVFYCLLILFLSGKTRSLKKALLHT